MGEMKVEHVLLFLVGAFLVYHMMGKCRSVEGLQSCISNYAASCPDFDPDLCKWNNGTWTVALNSGDGGQDIYYYYPDQKRCRVHYSDGTWEGGRG